MLVDEGKMRWDDPVRKHLPAFRLRDPLADRDVTVRDLLCHRTGLARHDLLRYAVSDRDELIRRVALLEPAHSFRARFEYNNLMWMTAGHAAGRVEGSAWENVIEKRLFRPLGMASATTSIATMEKHPDHARPHARGEQGRVEVRPLRYAAVAAPGGGINASARDLSRWLRFQLGAGAFEGKRLLSAAALAETHTPQVVVRQEGRVAATFPPRVTQQVSYGLGWFVYDYQGHGVVGHGGSWEGFRAQTVLVPRQRLGLVVLTNLGGCMLPDAVRNNLLDLLLDLPRHDWNAFYLKDEKTQRAEAQKRKRAAQRQPGTKPSRELQAFAGTYEDAAYGQVRIAPDGAALRLEWGSFILRLEHVHFDTFAVTSPPYLWDDARVTFRLGADGEVEGLTMLGRVFRKDRPRAQR
jgi:hypothetical protein